jgi:hypothetical protein
MTMPALVTIANTALNCHFLCYMTSTDGGGQQTRADDNVGCSETEATFRG